MDKEEAGIRAGEIARARLLEVLEAKGTLDRAALRLHQGLDAKVTKAKWVTITVDDEGQALNGGWVYSKPLVDHGTRARFVDLALKAMDVYPDDRFSVNIHGDLMDAIKTLNDRHRERTGGTSR